MLLCAALPVRAAEGPTLFFFSPDFSPGNLSVLKQAAEGYLREAGVDAHFQAFVRFEDFRRELLVQNPEFVVVPAWAVAPGCIDSALRPLAKPVRGGEHTGKKALIAPSKISGVGDLGEKTIAATMPPAGTLADSSLERLRREHPRVRIVAVPKDIDAILAVAFGQVDAAYVSTRQFGLFAAANPELGGELREIGYAESTPFPMIYATASANDADVDKMKHAALTAGEVGSGKRLVGLLGYDGWVAASQLDAGGDPAKRAAAGCTSLEERAK